jgi:thiamine biosynthesis lipoprotein
MIRKEIHKIFGFMKRNVIILFLVPVLAIAGTPYRYEASLDAMGTTFSVVVYGEDKLALAPAVDTAFEEVRRLDRKLSNYRPDSEWSQVNQKAFEQEVVVSQELFDLLAACQQYSRLSEGAFDITIGPLMKLWGFYKGNGRLPHRAEVRGVLNRVGYRHMALNAERRSVRFLKSGMEIDPGGIGKGYAVDCAVGVLKENGIRTALITAGGSSIYGLGAPPDERGWTVKIRHPRDSRKTAAEIVLSNESMSTSGSYEKFFRAEGKTFSHIMDPRTGFPAAGMYSVSVITPKTLDSEAWTKPFFIQGRKWAEARAPKGMRVHLCEDKGEAVCAWLQ